jgi:hypothetical protein
MTPVTDELHRADALRELRVELERALGRLDALEMFMAAAYLDMALNCLDPLRQQASHEHGLTAQ